VGNNSYDGLSPVVAGGDGPMLNVYAAIATAPDGATIVVDAGDYAESVWDIGANTLTLVPQGTVTICGPDLCEADTVGDGIPDWWRLQYFGTPTTTNSQSCASCTPTADGISNLDKFQCGLDPLTIYSLTVPAFAILNSAGHTASVPNFGWSSYVWSITDGTITTGQGTTNITWTAGSLGEATISLTASNSTFCNATLSATVAISNIDPTVTAIYNFTNNLLNPDNTGYPSQSPLVEGCDGNYYSTVVGEGAYGGGIVFQVSPSGIFTTLYSFCEAGGSYCLDGSAPSEGFVLGFDGNFYGTALFGGSNDAGTVFKVSTNGSFATIYTFASQTECYGLVQGSDSNFYGVTFNGVIFGITTNGAPTPLNFFSTSTDGIPYGPLVQSTNGDLYGTTDGPGQRGGAIFQFNNLSNSITIYPFAGQAFGNGAGPEPADRLIQGSDGNFYGVTRYGGNTNENSYGLGTVFKITPTGSLTTLNAFNGSDGENPWGPLVEGSDGNLYGVANGGGTNGDGTIFRVITTNGNFSVLYFFTGNEYDGALPVGGLVQGSDGNFYGLTESTIYRLTIPFQPPPNRISHIEVDGDNIVITVPSIASENYQLQYSPAPPCDTYSDILGAVVNNSFGGPITLTDIDGVQRGGACYRVHITNCDGNTYTDPVEIPPP
jgi:uncharacterized repeat protein (TIGR03803 family)